MLVGAAIVPREAAAQEGPGDPFCASVTPDAKAVNRTVAAQSDTFWVWNCGTAQQTYALTCSATGSITCTGLSQSIVTLAAGLSTTVLAYYTAAAGSGQLTLTAEGYSGESIDSGSYGITAGAPLVDATPWHPALQSYARCAQSCFAATYAQGTVPYVSLDAPRNVSLVYNGDRSDAKPFVHVNVTPDPGTAPPSEYQLKAKINGAFVTFLNGEQTLRFSYPGTAPHRLGGQFNAASYATGVHLMEIHVAGLFGAALRTALVNTHFVAVDTTYQVARAWRLGGIQRLYANGDGSRLVVEGDGSAVLFAAGSLAAPAGEFSVLRIGTPSGGGGWTRAYPDSTKVAFNTAGRMIEVRDRFNNIVTIVYDGSNRVSQIKDPLNLGMRLTYNANGLATIRDTMGRVTTVTVDGSKKLTQIRDPDNVSTTFGYDASRRLLTITNRRGHTTTLAYDTQSGKLASVTAPADTLAGTNGADSVLAPVATQAAWQKVGVPYGSTSPPVAPPKADTIKGSVTEPGGAVTRFTVNRWGMPVATTDALGRVTTVTYDTSGLPRRVQYPNSGVDTVAFNASGLPTFVRPAGDTAATNIRYAAWGIVDSVWGFGQPGVRRFVTAGKVDSVRVGATVQNPAGYLTRFRYDSRGRDTLVTDPVGHLRGKTWYAGTNGNRSKDSLPGGRVTTFVYDAYGRDTSMSATGLPTRRATYDVLNRVTAAYDGVNPLPTSYGYDSLVLKSVTDPKNQVYSFTTNKLGWVVRRTDPAGGVERWRHTRDGDLRKWTNRRNQVVEFRYDALHRQVKKWGAQTATDSMVYSVDDRVVTALSYSMTPTFTESTYFDVAGRADSVRTVLHGWAFWRRFRYTAAGLLDSVWATTPPGATLLSRRYAYNTSRGTLDSLRFGAPWTKLARNGELLTTSIDLPGPINSWTVGYTSLHGLTQIASNGYWRAFGYDTVGRLSRDNMEPLDVSYGSFLTYDGLGRLITDSVGSTSCIPDPVYSNICNEGVVADSVYSFGYDQVGNRTDHGGTYLTGNRISAFDGCSYGTDADGNVTSRTCGGTVTTFFWSAESRLDSVRVGTNTSRYAYDGGGRLARLDSAGTVRYFLWSGAELLAELNAAGAVLSEYSYYGLDNLHALATGGVTYYANRDARGSVRALNDTVPQVRAWYEYDHWGQSGSGSWWLVENRARWKGALDMGSGLYYMRARWYDTKTGRFLSEDPIGLAGGINPYPYAGSDPVNGWDPAGLDHDCRPVPNGVGTICPEGPHSDPSPEYTYDTYCGWGRFYCEHHDPVAEIRRMMDQEARAPTIAQAGPNCTVPALQYAASASLDVATIVGVGQVARLATASVRAGARSVAVGTLGALAATAGAGQYSKRLLCSPIRRGTSREV